MAKPLQMPMQKPMTRKLMEPVEPTAASAADPSSNGYFFADSRHFFLL